MKLYISLAFLERNIQKSLKKSCIILLMLGILSVPAFQVLAAENDTSGTEQPVPTLTPSPVPIRELVTKGNKIY